MVYHFSVFLFEAVNCSPIVTVIHLRNIHLFHYLLSFKRQVSHHLRGQMTFFFFVLHTAISFLPNPPGRPRYGFVTSLCILVSFGSLPFLMTHCSARRTSHLLLPDLQGGPPACLMPHCSVRRTSQLLLPDLQGGPLACQTYESVFEVCVFFCHLAPYLEMWRKSSIDFSYFWQCHKCYRI